jgi:protein disulfide-isomerase
MKRTIFKGLILTLLGAAMVSAPSVTAKTTKKAPAKKTTKTATPKWGTSYKDALAQAKKTGKPILIDFNATWCGPCHMLEDEVFKTSGFAAEAKNWILLTIDVDKHPDLANHYNAESIPLLVALSPKGRTAARQPGYGGYDLTMKWIKNAAQQAKK